MGQTVIVYILIVFALGGAVRYIWLKLKALKKEKKNSACAACPFKKNCAGSGCHSIAGAKD